MRAREFIFEESIAGYNIIYRQHLFDRLKEKNIPYAIVQKILQRVGRARKFIDEYGVEDAVSLYDSTSNVHLIVRKEDHDVPNLQVITAYRHENYRGLTPVFKIR